MELRVLNYFLMVAREENITRAAEMFHTNTADSFKTDCTVGRRTGRQAVSAQ